MSRSRKILRSAVAIAGLLALVSACLYAWSRLRGPTPDEQAALALLDAPSRFEGSNAFAALWLLPYDVPADEIEALATEDVRRFAQRPDPLERGAATETLAPFASIAATRYPEQHDTARNPCGSNGESCLAAVRASLADTRRSVEQRRRLIARIRALSRHGHYANAFAPRLDSPMPPLSATFWTLPSDALAFAEGRVDEALAGACGNIATWRRYVASSDSLIVSMFAISQTSQSSQLLAEMLAELPAGHALPGECRTASAAPTPAESSICESMRGEYRLVQGITRWMSTGFGSSAVQRWANSLLYDADMTLRMRMPAFAWACSGSASEAVARDAAANPPTSSDERISFEQFGNPLGAMLASITAPGYRDYFQRAQDHGARLQLLATLLWLREHAAGPGDVRARLAARPASLRSPTRDIEPGEDGRTIRIRMFDRRRGTHFELPLPPHLVSAAVPAAATGELLPSGAPARTGLQRAAAPRTR